MYRTKVTFFTISLWCFFASELAIGMHFPSYEGGFTGGRAYFGIFSLFDDSSNRNDSSIFDYQPPKGPQPNSGTMPQQTQLGAALSAYPVQIILMQPDKKDTKKKAAQFSYASSKDKEKHRRESNAQKIVAKIAAGKTNNDYHPTRKPHAWMPERYQQHIQERYNPSTVKPTIKELYMYLSVR